MHNRYRKLFIFLVGITFLYFPLFLKLDYLPFRMWDESRPAIQAYEMVQSHNFLVTTIGGEPDMWYTKPPLVTWLQAACIAIFGFNELAVRLPTALFALATCLLLVHFINRQTRSQILGWIAALVLVTLDGYTRIHGSRSGDVDVPLTFFLLLCATSLFNFLQQDHKKYLYFFFLSLAGAMLCKGVAGLFLLPAFVLFIILRKKLFSTLKNPHAYIAFLLFALPVLGFYLLRESYNPGYLKAVWNNEWMGRYANTLEGHDQGFWYYAEQLYDLNLLLWICLFPVGFFVGLFHTNDVKRSIATFFSLIIWQYFLLISFSETKTPWYDIPLYPFCTVFIALAIDAVYSALPNKRNAGALGYLFLVIVFLLPYKDTYKRISRRGEPYVWDEEEYSLSYYLQSTLKKNDTNLDGTFICTVTYAGHLVPYVKLFHGKKQELHFIEPPFLKTGNRVLAHQDIVKSEIENTYTYEVLDTFQFVKLYRIGERR